MIIWEDTREPAKPFRDTTAPEPEPEPETCPRCGRQRRVVIVEWGYAPLGADKDMPIQEGGHVETQEDEG